MDVREIFSGGFGALILLAAFVLTIIWIALPAAIFGIKPLLRQLIELLVDLKLKTEETNRLLAAIAPPGARSSPGPGASTRLVECPSCHAMVSATAQCPRCGQPLNRS